MKMDPSVKQGRNKVVTNPAENRWTLTEADVTMCRRSPVCRWKQRRNSSLCTWTGAGNASTRLSGDKLKIFELRNDVIYLKACPKCSGDVELADTPDGRALQCLQCSFKVDSPESAKRAAAEKAKKTTAAA